MVCVVKTVLETFVASDLVWTVVIIVLLKSFEAGASLNLPHVSLNLTVTIAVILKRPSPTDFFIFIHKISESMLLNLSLTVVVAVKAMSVLSAVLVVHLSMNRVTFQQLLHFVGRKLRDSALVI